MNSDAIDLVTDALQKVLSGVGTVYVGPLDDAGAKGHDFTLFLYRVAVNPHLRNSEHRVPPLVDGDPVIVYQGSLPLDLYYLLTAVKPSDPEVLKKFGHAMQVMNDTANLVGKQVQGETVRLSLDPITSEEMSRIWTLFPAVNYRTSVVYLATPVWLDPARLQTPATPVSREPHRIGQPRAESAA